MPYKELQTVLLEIKGILKNRPLTLYGTTISLTNTDTNEISLSPFEPILEFRILNNIIVTSEIGGRKSACVILERPINQENQRQQY